MKSRVAPCLIVDGVKLSGKTTLLRHFTQLYPTATVIENRWLMSGTMPAPNEQTRRALTAIYGLIRELDGPVILSRSHLSHEATTNANGLIPYCTYIKNSMA